MSADVKPNRGRARLGGLLPLAVAATIVCVIVHEAARVAADTLGGVEALMGAVDGALFVALAFLALFAARLALLFVLPGLLLFAVVDLGARLLASRFRGAASDRDADREVDRSEDG